MRHILPTALIVLAALSTAAAQPYEPTWESLDRRPVADWFSEAKFGIFIHFGVYSVPAWAPKDQYSEWYWYQLVSVKDSPIAKWHREHFGPDFKYPDFAPMFKAELFDAAEWADLFKNAGARYVVLTSKHHDGYCLWPSAQSWNWNSVDIGPHIDFCGELSKAVNEAGLKMGYYYSLYEWYNPFYKNDLERYVDEHMLPQMRDLVTRYKPAMLWTDGEWEHPSETWRSTEFLSWLFNESPVKDEIVINDRWGKECRSHHGGFYTTEYGKHHEMKDMTARPWEECRGIGSSFGYNRNESAADYSSPDELIELLVETVCRGGNLLLDVGPTADGRIPVIMQERLLQIGEWLSVNGEAIYGTHPHKDVQAEEAPAVQVRYTAKDDAVYAICLGWPHKLELDGVTPGENPKVTMLGLDRPLACRVEKGKLKIDVPLLTPDSLPCRYAYVFKLTGVE